MLTTMPTDSRPQHAAPLDSPRGARRIYREMDAAGEKNQDHGDDA